MLLAEDFDPWDYQPRVSRSGRETTSLKDVMDEALAVWDQFISIRLFPLFLDVWYGKLDHEKLRGDSLAQLKAIGFFAHC